jgi:hypothetical protein
MWVYLNRLRADSEIIAESYQTLCDLAWFSSPQQTPKFMYLIVRLEDAVPHKAYIYTRSANGRHRVRSSIFTISSGLGWGFRFQANVWPTGTGHIYRRTFEFGSTRARESESLYPIPTCWPGRLEFRFVGCLYAMGSGSAAAMHQHTMSTYEMHKLLVYLVYIKIKIIIVASSVSKIIVASLYK